MYEPEGVEPQEPVVAEPQVTEPQPQPAPLEPGGKRFDQVYRQMKDYETKYNQYKEYGDPAELKTRLDQLKQYEEAIKKYREQQAMTPDEQQENQRKAQIKKELLSVMPNLTALEKIEALEKQLQEYQGRFSESQAEATLKEMSSKFTNTLKAAKIDPKFQDKIEDYIVSQMTEEERQEFVRGNYEIAERIFTNELKDGIFSQMRKAPPIPALRNTPGGTPPSGQPKKAMTLEEAANIGFGMISNRE
jgi:tetratricopeptide (TPR) repeat protein